MSTKQYTFKMYQDPKTPSECCVVRGNVRFSILSDTLIRVEQHPLAQFEERATQTVIKRNVTPVHYSVTEDETTLIITTSKLRVDYIKDESRPLDQTVTITMLESGKVYHHNEEPYHSLPGTISTLDGIDGWVGLPKGHLTLEGWTAIDDSTSHILGEDGNLYERQLDGVIDTYFFYYGKDFKHFLKEFFMIAGPSPLIPRYALGNWWSRYFAYTDQELLDLMDTFKAKEMPLSVCIVDMDWHLEGWTGYTWNRDLFKDPTDFFTKLHNMGLKTALNLHPADGIAPHEEMYEDAKRYMRKDESFNESIPFALDDDYFTKTYFELLHHPREAEGVDFWWIDWQQQNEFSIKGLDTLWLLNHQHYLDLQRDNMNRPMTFSRWSKQGSHRYPIAFSGDTIVTWDSLSFQPYMTAAASNVACFWWSHDIGGHMGGVENGELFTRWVQYGVFSPILRIHSSNNPFQDRRPWMYSKDEFEQMRAAMQLRHRLIPYIYSINHLNEQGVPLISPMYYYHEEDLNVYHAKNAYYFGTELIAAPFTSPKDESTNLTHQQVYLPDGDFFDFFTGEPYKGGRTYEVYGTLEDTPVFAKAGAIVPMDAKGTFGEIGNPENMLLTLFPGNGEFEMYEDDGETLAYQQGVFAKTNIKTSQTDSTFTCVISPSTGSLELIPSGRHYAFEIKGIQKPAQVIVKKNEEVQSISFGYEQNCLTLQAIEVLPTDTIEVIVSFENEMMATRQNRRERLEQLLHKVSMSNDLKINVYWAFESIKWGTYSRRLLDSLPTSVKNMVLDTVLDR